MAPKLPPRCTRSSVDCAFARNSAIRASLLFSGTEIKICPSSISAAVDTLAVSRALIALSISTSVIRIRPGTLRSTKRCNIIWSSKSLRAFSMLEPDASVLARMASTVVWFCAACLCSARSSASSSITTPVSLAFCSKAFSVMSFSSTSRKVTSLFKMARPCCAAWVRCTSRRALTSWLVMGTESTTATMKSRGVLMAFVIGLARPVPVFELGGLRGLMLGLLSLSWACANGGKQRTKAKAKISQIRLKEFKNICISRNCQSG